MPSYLEEKMDLVLKMVQGEIPISANSIGAGLASILTALEAVNVILGKGHVVAAPRYIYLDLLDRIFTA